MTGANMRMAASSRRRSMAKESLLSCPKCFSRHSSVLRTELMGDTKGPLADLGEIAKRRRQCAECGHRWTTREIGPELFEILKRLMAMARSDD